MRRKLAVILAADVAGYSRLIAADEETIVARFAKLKGVFGELVESFHGRIFNTAGDAILAEFQSATDAVRCAIEIQDSVRARNLAFPDDRQIRFRIGIAIGDVLVQEGDGDLLGDGVNIAARLQSLAKPGGICISSDVHSYVDRNLSCSVVDMGPQELKNIDRPVRAYGIELGGERGPATVLAAPARLAAEPRPQRRREGGRRPVALVAGLALLAGMGAGGWYYLTRGRAAPEAPRAPQTAGQPAAAPARGEAAIAAALRLAMPSTARDADRIAAEYMGFPAQKSFAIAPGKAFWRARGLETPATAEVVGLEGCQIAHNAPCLLLARGEDVLPEGDPMRRDPQAMERVAYAGPFNPAMIPAVPPGLRTRPDIVGYAALAGPKAIALSPFNSRVAVAVGPTQAEAEAKALAECDARKGAPSEMACLLYAAGNAVVLPQRRTAADPPPAQAARPPGDKPDDPAQAILAELRKFAYRPGYDIEPGAATYAAQEPYKAIAVAPGLGLWHMWRAVSPQDAEILSLEGCQISYGKPCILVFRGDTPVPETDEMRKTPQSMPRVTYSGPFDPSKIPFLSPSVRVRQDVVGYPVLPGPKAMAIHPVNRAVIAQGGDIGEAEVRALAACNATVNRAQQGPCRTYALDNAVVLPQRRAAAQ